MADEETKEEKKFPIKLLIILMVAVIAGGGGYFAYTKYLSAKTEPEKVTNEAATEASETAAKDAFGPIYHMAPFIVNLADGDGRRYLKTTIELEMAEDEIRVEVDKRLPMLRDAILILLSSKTFEEINDIQGKMTLRQEMESKLDSLISPGAVRRVYFTEFVVQ